MKKIYALSLFVLLLMPALLNAQADKYETPTKLKHWMTPEEAKLRHLIGRDFEPTDPPPAPVNSLAEFNPMEGALVRYPFGIPMSLVAELSENDKVTTIVANQNEENTVIGMYQSNGVNMDNCSFLHAPTDSYWTRDYGPWFIIDGNDEVGIVDFPYNRPRPNDDEIPVFVSQMMDVPLYGMNLIHTGGNWMSDGMGIGASTDLVYQENPGLSAEDVDELVLDYLGITTYHVVDDPNNTYIDHIDCWGKFLDVDKILIRAVPASHPQFADLEDMAAYWAEQICSYGYNYNVVRVYTPQDQPYSNSLILNNKVYVPITNSQWDDDALQTYEDAMPGYEVNGFYGSWESTDALHCRTHEMADKEMLFVEHQPLFGAIPQGVPFDLSCTIKALSGESLKTDSLLVFYNTNGSDWQTTALTAAGNDEFTATIPAAANGSSIQYYLYAADESGRTTRHPFIGAADPHVFSVGAPEFPTIVVSPFNINRSCLTGNTCGGEITVNNMGAAVLNFDVLIEEDAKNMLAFRLEDTPAPERWKRNTLIEAKSSEIFVQEDGLVHQIEIAFDYSVNNYPYENSIWIKAPSGKKAELAKGLQNGHYIFKPEAFEGLPTKGRWSLWIEDNFGDGGAQMSNISLSLATESQRADWISVDPMTGSVGPEDNMTLDYTLDATNLEAGDYTGRIIFESNDPDNPEAILPVTLHVKEPSDLTVNPDTLWFNHRKDVDSGLVFYIANRDLINHDLLEMNHEGSNETFAWSIDPWTLDLPTFIPKKDSIELNVKINALQPWPELNGEMAYDSILVSSELSTQKLVLAIDPLALYRDVEIDQDTLKFLTSEAIMNGQSFTMFNPCPDSVEIVHLPMEVYGNWFYIVEHVNGPFLPNFWMQPMQQQEYKVFPGLPVASEVNILIDSMMIETESHTHKIILQLDADLISDIAERQQRPVLALSPNPVHDFATIHLEVKKNEHISLDLYKNNGQLRMHIFDGMLSTGNHKIQFHPHDIPAGLYFIMLETASGKRSAQKVLIVD